MKTWLYVNEDSERERFDLFTVSNYWYWSFHGSSYCKKVYIEGEGKKHASLLNTRGDDAARYVCIQQKALLLGFVQ